ncbi:hypothetical protein [Myxococcus sp. AB056]|uniref:hypothetical protein n=1 Tax=Myxococcus sp. AB056 TaxID=2562792 RepID=UPI001890C485|nr:hypothetical protein [Myxococcus sp. AB056]
MMRERRRPLALDSKANSVFASVTSFFWNAVGSSSYTCRAMSTFSTASLKLYETNTAVWPSRRWQRARASNAKRKEKPTWRLFATQRKRERLSSSACW